MINGHPASPPLPKRKRAAKAPSRRFLVLVDNLLVWRLPVPGGAEVGTIEDAFEVCRRGLPEGVQFEVREEG